MMSHGGWHTREWQVRGYLIPLLRCLSVLPNSSGNTFRASRLDGFVRWLHASRAAGVSGEVGCLMLA